MAAKSSGRGRVADRGGMAEHGQVPLADHRRKVIFTCVIPGPTQWHAQSRCDTEESVQPRTLKTGYHKVFFFFFFKEKSRNRHIQTFFFFFFFFAALSLRCGAEA